MVFLVNETRSKKHNFYIIITRGYYNVMMDRLVLFYYTKLKVVYSSIILPKLCIKVIDSTFEGTFVLDDLYM